MTQATLSPVSELRASPWTLRQMLTDGMAYLVALLAALPFAALSVVLSSRLAAIVQTGGGASPLSETLIDVQRLNENLQVVGFYGTILIFVIALLFGGWMRARQRRRQIAGLNDAMRFAHDVASGNLGVRLAVSGSDDAVRAKLSQALNEMATGVHAMTREVRDASHGLAEATRQIFDATSRQIDAATQQDDVVNQTTATVNEVRATVTETAERAQSVAENAQASIEVSRSGQEAVADAIEGMQIIRRRVEDIADNILILSEHTQQIGEIIATVNSIADQSKMLALNASVEAARAGEEGKGFAVVAMEVRSLAEQSREATSQVRDILSEIQRATNAAVMVTEEGTKGVDHGVGLVDRAGQTIQELARTIEDNALAAVQIAASTREQAVGMDQLTSAMRTIKDSTAEAASSTMQVERSVQKLQNIAEHLGNAIARYRI